MRGPSQPFEERLVPSTDAFWLLETGKRVAARNGFSKEESTDFEQRICFAGTIYVHI
jgi:hypothetical protein